MTKFRTVNRNGKKRVVPVSDRKTVSINRQISPSKVNEMGIRNPGSLTDLGYRMREPWQKRKEAIDQAVQKYGRDRTAWKFSDLVRMNSRRPELRNIALHDLHYVTGQ